MTQPGRTHEAGAGGEGQGELEQTIAWLGMTDGEYIAQLQAGIEELKIIAASEKAQGKDTEMREASIKSRLWWIAQIADPTANIFDLARDIFSREEIL
jgi:hypothetical protein